jgi:hypothetical protein
MMRLPALLLLTGSLAACGGTSRSGLPAAGAEPDRCEMLLAEWEDATAVAEAAAERAEERERRSAEAVAPGVASGTDTGPGRPPSPLIAEGATEVAAAEAPFPTLCPFEWTTGFVASLERALIVRGYLEGPADGVYDEALAEAVRAAQAPLGIDSDVLSLEAARALGLVRLSPDQLRAI